MMQTNNHTQEIDSMQCMFDNMPLMAAIFDADYNMIDCNAEALRSVGAPGKAFYMANWDVVFCPETQPDGTESAQYAREKLAVAFERGSVRFDWVSNDFGGNLFPMEITARRTVFRGQPVLCAYGADISDTQQSRAEEREATLRAQLMYESTPMLIEFWSDDNEIVDCNPYTLEMFEIATRSEYMRTHERFFPETQADGSPSWAYWVSNLSKIFAYGRHAFDMIFVDRYNELIYTEVVGISMISDGNNIAITYASDVTQFMKRRIAEENSESKSKFLANMSHEIRTPISAVLGIAQIQLQNPALSADVDEAFAKIYSSAGVLLNIINDILDISKIEAGKMDIVNTRYDVAGMVLNTTQMHSVYMGDKDISFVVDIDADMPACLIGDELRIKQVLGNLISNAIKYTDEGRVTLSMTFEYASSPQLCIQIQDTGRGMTPKQVEALQLEYTRFHEHSDRTTQGTGLGMSIVYSLVRLMNGSIDVTSEVGVGTTVVLRVPQIVSGSERLGADAADDLAQMKVNPALYAKKISITPESMPYGTVLVVDDVETNLYVAQGLLKFYSLQVETVMSGQAAVQRITDGARFDIIFMDHMMPEMNGMEAASIIRSLGYADPIIALTANALAGQAEQFLQNGFDGYLSKPIQTAALNDILNKFIRDKQPPEVLEAAKTLTGSRNMDDFIKDADVLVRIQGDFVRSQKDVVPQIRDALQAGDFEAAQRLAHTLKGLAGLLHENVIVQLARQLESAFEIGNTPPADTIDALEREMQVVCAEIAPADVQKTDDMPIDASYAAQILDELALLLADGDASAIQYRSKLAGIPHTDDLTEYLQDFDFDSALEALEDLRQKLGL